VVRRRRRSLADRFAADLAMAEAAASPYDILTRKRAGAALSDAEIGAVVRGAADGSLGDAELGAFLMAAAIRGLDRSETRALTLAMLDSGERWELRRDAPGVVDKHSTGGIGDKTSLILGPLLAACGVPVAMLTGRALGHTGGTADKLESIPGLRLDLDRARALELLASTGLAIGMATGDVAPADRRFYAIRDRTATVESLELITASILSKKLATGAAGVVFDVKSGSGAFMPQIERAGALARSLVDTCAALGQPAAALLTDMSQPLGRWAGHTAEVRETLEALAGDGAADLMEVTLALAAEAARLGGHAVSRAMLEKAIASGAARERFDLWAVAQGASADWLRQPDWTLAPEEVPLRAARSGVLTAIDCRALGLLLAEAGAGRAAGSAEIDFGVSLRSEARLGDALSEGDEMARLYLRRRDAGIEARLLACYTIADRGSAPPLIGERIGAARSA
jgi:pyrimidine-nucleoside phosphorylase